MCDEYVDVCHEGPFPHGAVQALFRGLDNHDHTCRDAYVALCYYNGEPCFGRACRQHDRVYAWFPWGDRERDSNEMHHFQMLVNRGRECDKGFKYVWKEVHKIRHKRHKFQPVLAGCYSPCVVRDVCGIGEMLGKINLEKEMAWTSYNGKENIHTGEQFYHALVLCRKPCH